MSISWLRAAFGSAAVLASILWLSGCDDGALMRSRPQLRFSPMAVDFGEVAVNSPELSRSIRVENPGGSRLSIDVLELQAQPGAPFSTTAPRSLVLEKGESVELAIAFRPPAPGVFGATLHVESDAENAPIVDIQVAGRVLPVATDAGSSGGPDGGPDAGSDAGVDAGLDAGSDAGLDAGLDAGSDAGLDAGSDAGADAGMDAGLDAGVSVDAGCGVWRVLPAEGTTGMDPQWRALPSVDGRLFLVSQYDSAGQLMPPFEVRQDGDGGRVSLNGTRRNCTAYVMGRRLVLPCSSSVTWLELDSMTWDAGAARPPRCGPGRFDRQVGDTRLFSWDLSGSSAACVYDAVSDRWETVTDAGRPSWLVEFIETDGTNVVLLPRGSGELAIYSTDAGAWREVRPTLPDGGTLFYKGALRFGARLFVLGVGRFSDTDPWVTAELELTDGGLRLLPTTGDLPTGLLAGSLTAGASALVVPRDPTSRRPAPRGWLFSFDGGAGTWARLTGDPVEAREWLGLSAGTSSFFAYGGAPWERASDGGLARGNLFELRPPATSWRALDDAVLGVPATGLYTSSPNLSADAARRRALLAAEPQALFDPVALRWEAAPRRPFEALKSVAGPSGTHVFQNRRGATLGPAGWTLWSLDGGPTSTDVGPLMAGADVFLSDPQVSAGFVYSTALDVLEPTPPVGAPATRSRQQVSTAGPTSVLVYGGWDLSTRNPFSDGALYDRATNRWSPVAAAGNPGPMLDAVTLWTGSEVLFLGGDGAPGLAQSLFSYRPSTNTWASLAPFPGRLLTAFYLPAMALTPGGRVLAVGYTTSNGVLTSVYEPSSNTWRCTTQLSLGTGNPPSFAATVVDGRVVLLGVSGRPLFWTAVVEGL